MKTKIYDKRLYKLAQDTTEAILAVLVFLLGYLMGVYAMTSENKKQEEYIKVLEQNIIEQEDIEILEKVEEK